MDDAERDKFMSEATPVGLEVQDGPMLVLLAKRFSSGSVGWYSNGKLVVQDREVQFNICFTVVGSKPGWEPRQRDNGQPSTMPEKAPETPRALFEAENGSKPVKKPRKRS